MKLALTGASVLVLGLFGVGLLPGSAAQSSCYAQYEGIHQFTLTDALVIIHDHLRDITDGVWVTGPTTILATAVGDTNGNGREELRTEMLEMQLAGASGSFGAVKVSESPARSSWGLVEEISAGTCFPAISFFDVFIETETPVLSHNDAPVHMQTTLYGIPPPQGQTYVGPTGEAELFAGASHPPEVPQLEELVAHIEHAKHYPTPERDTFCDANEAVGGIPLSSPAPLFSAGPGILAPMFLLAAAGRARGTRFRLASLLLGLGAVGLGLVPTAEAHAKSYYMTQEDLTYVCWKPGHVVPNVNGDASLSISDAFFTTVVGIYCQDVDGDLTCGEPDDQVTGNYREPNVPFCNSVTINTPLDSTSRTRAAWASSDNWATDETVFVYILGPTRANQFTVDNPCGAIDAWGQAGIVNHS